ncbi:MAG: DUF4358 domain-containing protein [Butyrivibrio sp.]|nr:DUF4358 domain-containing protein [Lachnospiraceae bacterium]MBP3199994.1 DUF4358 domain-containing protein [Butyrivibrio sp.]
MKKKFFAVLLSLVVVLSLVACGSKDKKSDSNEAGNTDAASVDVDVKALADALKNGCDFKDNMAEIDPAVGLTRVLNIADTSIIEESAFYTNSSASAEDIIVIKATSAENVKIVTAAFDVRISTQKAACADYLPDEIPKLDAAVKYTNGQYAVLVVSNDSAKAQEIIDGYFK